MMTHKRYDYIDIARGVGILTVVWAHIMVTGWSHGVIYSFHMPLFFFLSGMMFRREKFSTFKSFLVHRAKRLLIPYVIYSVVTWAFWAAFRYLRHDEVVSYFAPLLQTFIAQGSGAFIAHNSALWFIPCLFLVEMLYFHISRLGRLWSVALCFAMAALSFGLGNMFGDSYWFTPPWNADAALIALPFYAVGNLLTSKVGHERMIKSTTGNRGGYLFLWVVMFSVLVYASVHYGECSMGSSSYQCSAWIFIPRAFLGIACMLLLSLLMAQTHSVIVRYAKWAGVNSLDIMCLHIPLKGIFMIIVARAFYVSVDEVSGGYPYSLVAFVLTMVAAWPIIRVIDKYLRKA